MHCSKLLLGHSNVPSTPTTIPRAKSSTPRIAALPSCGRRQRRLREKPAQTPIPRHPSRPHQQILGIGFYRRSPAAASPSASSLATVARDELREGFELLLEEVSGGVVFELARLVVKLSRASANEDFRFVEREGIEKDHHAAQVVLHATAAERTRRGRLDRDRLAGKRLVR